MAFPGNFTLVPRSWGFFQSMPSNGGLNILNYSAGLIGGQTILPIPDAHRPRMHRYPRRVWNWIYVGASDGEVLFGENVKPPRGILARSFAWLKDLLR